MSDSKRKRLAAVDGRIDENVTAMLRLPQSILQREAHLFRRKWFDYRFISGTKATEKFGEAYRVAYRAAFRTNFDAVEASKKQGLSEAGPYFDQRELTSLWRARQFADELGLPYDLFLSWAFDGFFMRRGYTRVPRPNQLYAEKLRIPLEAHLAAKWLEHRQEVRLMHSQLPEYGVSAYCQLAAQDDHYAWIVEQLRLRTGLGLRVAIARVCFATPLLPVDRAMAEFGTAVVERAQEEPEAASLEGRQGARAEALPGCFGAPYIVDTSRPGCATCAFQALCSGAARLAQDRVISRAGVSDPAGARRKNQQRDRTRRCRERQRLMLHCSM